MKLIDIATKLNRQGNSFIKSHGIKEFHKKAHELLSAADLPKHYDFQEIVEHTFNSTHPQNFKHLEFSDLPITLAHAENCFIELYFWRRRPTVIHNHHFAGAFMCLSGNNLDLEFSFQKERKVGRFHELGKLELKRVRPMRAGDIAEIGFMDKFIHQNHHQADLTVNLCFRTPQEPKKNLSNYLYSGLRYEKSTLLEGRIERLYRYLSMGEFKTNNLNITQDDAIAFLIRTYDIDSGNPKIIALRDGLHKRIKKELKVDVFKLLQYHDHKMNKLEETYD